MRSIWKEIYPEVKEIFPRIKKEQLVEIPIPYINKEKQKEIITIIDKIINYKKKNISYDTSALEHEIDQLVYQLYGLTEKEIAIIEESCKQK